MPLVRVLAVASFTWIAIATPVASRLPPPEAAPSGRSDVRPLAQTGTGGDASAVLAAARTFLGGVARLDDVKALELRRSNQTVRVLFPDRYQIETPRSVSTFDGTKTWRKAGVEAMPIPVPPAASTLSAADARRAGLRRVADYALTYLVRVLPEYPLTATLVPDASCPGFAGACVEFRAPGAERPALLMAFDRSTGQPLGSLVPVASSSGGLAHGVSEFRDYRDVSGIKVPFLIATKVIGDPAGRPSPDWPHTAIVINPPLTRADFEEK